MCHLLTDGDIVRYKSASAAQHTYYNVYPKDTPQEDAFLIRRFSSHKEMKAHLKQLGKKETDFAVVKDVVVQEPFKAKLICDAMMSRIYREVGATEGTIFLDPGLNFRHDIAKYRPYKDRKQEKPVHYELIGEYLERKYGAVYVKGIETDDALAIFAHKCRLNDKPYVIASVDKDLKMIPGLHYNIDHYTITNITYEEARHRFFRQVLTGDITDTIEGLPGIGEKTADKILDGCTTTEDYVNAVVNKYVNTGPEVFTNKGKKVPEDMRDYLNEVANLIYIRHNPTEGVKL